jgi:hypothetical protein
MLCDLYQEKLLTNTNNENDKISKTYIPDVIEKIASKFPSTDKFKVTPQESSICQRRISERTI